jgi:hypothetical protein
MNAARKQTLTIADLRMEMVAKIAAAFGLIVVVASFAFSFAQLQWIAASLGVHPWALSFLFPFIIDMPSVVASALTVALHDREFRVRAYAWSILIVFTSLSWMCNAIHAVDKADKLFAIIPSYPLALALVILISGIPPIGVVLGMHLWAYALRHSSGADQRSEVTATVEQQNKPRTAPAPKPKSTPATAAAASAPAPAARPAEPAPVPARAEAPAERVDARNIEDVVREIARQMIAEDDSEKPDGAEVRRRAGLERGDKPVPQTTRGWVREEWDAHLDARETNDARADLRAEVRIADPVEDEIEDGAPSARHAANVA